MISVLAMEIIDGKGEGRALQLSTGDPLELRETQMFLSASTQSVSCFLVGSDLGPMAQRDLVQCPELLPSYQLSGLSGQTLPAGPWDPCLFQCPLFFPQDRGCILSAPPDWQGGWAAQRITVETSVSLSSSFS